MRSRCALLFVPSFLSNYLTYASMRGVEGSGRVAVVSGATALAPAAHSVMLAVVADAPATAPCGQPHSLGEVTALCVSVTFTLFSNKKRTQRKTYGDKETVWIKESSLDISIVKLKSF